MHADTYTKVVLTLIAIGLFVNAGLQLISPAFANKNEVAVTNFETDAYGGETLYVYCKNCD